MRANLVLLSQGILYPVVGSCFDFLYIGLSVRGVGLFRTSFGQYVRTTGTCHSIGFRSNSLGESSEIPDLLRSQIVKSLSGCHYFFIGRTRSQQSFRQSDSLLGRCCPSNILNSLAGQSLTSHLCLPNFVWIEFIIISPRVIRLLTGLLTHVENLMLLPVIF